MKKTLLLTLLIISGVLAGCSNNDNNTVLCTTNDSPEMEASIKAKYQSLAEQDIKDKYRARCEDQIKASKELQTQATKGIINDIKDTQATGSISGNFE